MGTMGRIRRISSITFIVAMYLISAIFSNSVEARDSESAKNNLYKISSAIKNLQGDFTQFEYDEKGRPLRVLEGKFKMTDKLQLWWQVDPPYAQTIISNGTHTMIYDNDLQQLIVRTLDRDNLPPFFFITSNPQILDAMSIVQPDLEQPTFFVSDSNIDIFVQFDKKLPAEISWENELNQRITIHLDKLSKNRRIAKKVFNFKPPPGTSIITE